MYTFHHLASCVPGFLHAITGLKIFSGQPENRMDEDHSDKLTVLTTKMTMLMTQSGEYVKKLQLVMQKLRETKLDTPEAKKENSQKMASCQATIQACQNVSAMAARLKSINLKNPEFLSESKAVKLSFKAAQGGAGNKRGRDNAPAARGGIRGGGGGAHQPAAKKQANAGAKPGEKPVYRPAAGGGRGGMVMRGGGRGGRGGMRGRGGRRW